MKLKLVAVSLLLVLTSVLGACSSGETQLESEPDAIENIEEPQALPEVEDSQLPDSQSPKGLDDTTLKGLDDTTLPAEKDAAPATGEADATLENQGESDNIPTAQP
ncbi:MAG: hypothetical protein F6K58_14240 [Symploca sp. SIO2E9]|nr:hypothetical protein [Symploca sp. SIO2E9]